jgi:fatty-acyl-CoA synthase
VAVWGQNVPEWVTLHFATGKTGTVLVTIVLVTINPAYKSNELRYLLEQSDAAALFLTEGVKDTDFVEILKEAVPDLADAEPGEELEIEGLPYLKHVVLIGDEASTNLPGTVGYDEFVKGTEKVSDDSLHERQGALDADEAINMRYIETGIDLEALIGCAQLLEELLERELPGQVMKAGICGHLKEGS